MGCQGELVCGETAEKCGKKCQGRLLPGKSEYGGNLPFQVTIDCQHTTRSLPSSSLSGEQHEAQRFPLLLCRHPRNSPDPEFLSATYVSQNEKQIIYVWSTGASLPFYTCYNPLIKPQTSSTCGPRVCFAESLFFLLLEETSSAESTLYTYGVNAQCSAFPKFPTHLEKGK